MGIRPISLVKSFLLRLFYHLESSNGANFCKLRSTFKLQIQLAMRQKEKKKYIFSLIGFSCNFPQDFDLVKNFCNLKQKYRRVFSAECAGFGNVKTKRETL